MPPRFPIAFPDGRVRLDEETGCWIWIGARSKNGYGALKVDGKQHSAHRLFFQIFMGPIPDALHIDHLCRNRACVNPEHMEPVYPAVNILRGHGAAAANARKTHCKRGHPLDGENLIVERTTGKRQCRTCKRETYRRYRARKKGAVAWQ